jgi:long-subunit fatty acid transport protein
MTTFGARRNGMAASVARPDDLTALFHNPAGLADQRGLRFHASSLVFTGSTEVRLQALDPARFPAINPEGCGEGGAPPCPWPIAADGYYARPIETGTVVGAAPFVGVGSDLGFAHPRLGDLVIAAAVFLPDLMGGAWDAGTPAAYHVIDATFLVLAVTVGAGWRIGDTVAVGAALSYNHMRLSQSRKISPTDVLTPAGEPPDLLAQTAQATIGDVVLDYHGVDHGLGWTAGLLLDPLPWLSLGLTYGGATAARFEGALTIEAPHLAGTTSIEDALRGLGYKVPRGLSVEQSLPHAFFFGINVRPVEWLELGLDYRVWPPRAPFRGSALATPGLRAEPSALGGVAGATLAPPAPAGAARRRDRRHLADSGRDLHPRPPLPRPCHALFGRASGPRPLAAVGQLLALLSPRARRAHQPDLAVDQRRGQRPASQSRAGRRVHLRLS